MENDAGKDHREIGHFEVLCLSRRMMMSKLMLQNEGVNVWDEFKKLSRAQ